MPCTFFNTLLGNLVATGHSPEYPPNIALDKKTSAVIAKRAFSYFDSFSDERTLQHWLQEQQLTTLQCIYVHGYESTQFTTTVMYLTLNYLKCGFLATLIFD